jgi:hypothetical protein
LSLLDLLRQGLRTYACAYGVLVLVHRTGTAYVCVCIKRNCTLDTLLDTVRGSASYAALSYEALSSGYAAPTSGHTHSLSCPLVSTGYEGWCRTRTREHWEGRSALLSRPHSLALCGYPSPTSEHWIRGMVPRTLTRYSLSLSLSDTVWDGASYAAPASGYCVRMRVRIPRYCSVRIPAIAAYAYLQLQRMHTPQVQRMHTPQSQ